MHLLGVFLFHLGAGIVLAVIMPREHSPILRALARTGVLIPQDFWPLTILPVIQCYSSLSCMCLHSQSLIMKAVPTSASFSGNVHELEIASCNLSPCLKLQNQALHPVSIKFCTIPFCQERSSFPHIPKVATSYHGQAAFRWTHRWREIQRHPSLSIPGR